MLLDANLLLLTANADDDYCEPAQRWLGELLDARMRVGFPWSSLVTFVRISTDPRIFREPLTMEESWQAVEGWLAAESAWTPVPGPRHAAVLADLCRRHRLRGDMLPDAHLTALAIEHGLTVCSRDTDFARFPEIRWLDPLRE